MTADDRQPTAARRDIFKAGVGLGTALLLGGSGRLLRPAAAQEAATATAADLCLLTPELMEGPFYVDDPLLRRDVTEGKPGVPLKLRLAVADVNTCAPLANAAVDIWHCDAHGYYSGVSANNPGPDADPALVAAAAQQMFLRGVQLTNEEGIAEFTTIYPGWYQGRTIHIHVKVHVDGAAGGELYEGGHVAHIGQLFFADAISDEVFATAQAYAGRPDNMRTRNDQDGILGGHLDEPGFLIALTPLAEGSVQDGFEGTITFAVDPTATPEPVGFGGGPPPQG